MYAVIRTGGKQYKVAENDVIAVEKLDGEAGAGITISDVLALHDGEEIKVGSPLVDGAVVTADVLEQGRANKILVFKKKRRQNYRRTKGHRQAETVLRITGIHADATTAAAARAKAKPAAKAEAEAKPAPAAAETAAPAEAEARVEAKTETKTAPKTAAKKPAAKKPAAKKPAAKKPAAKKE